MLRSILGQTCQGHSRLNECCFQATAGFEAGIIAHLTEKLHAGFRVENPVGGKFGKDQQEKIQSVYAVGLGYDASEKFCVTAEIEKSENQPVNVVSGFQYKPVPQLLVRAGFFQPTSQQTDGSRP